MSKGLNECDECDIKTPVSAVTQVSASPLLLDLSENRWSSVGASSHSFSSYISPHSFAAAELQERTKVFDVLCRNTTLKRKAFGISGEWRRRSNYGRWRGGRWYKHSSLESPLHPPVVSPPLPFPFMLLSLPSYESQIIPKSVHRDTFNGQLIL